MTIEEQIRQSLEAWCKKFGPAPTLLATVVSVDESSFTCVLKDDDGNIIPAVRLRPVLDGNESVTLVPSVNSWALAVRIEAVEEWMLIAAGVVDKCKVVIGTTTIQQSADGFEMMKGTSSLKNILTNIIEACQQILVIYGNNPDYTKLSEALDDTNNLFS
jgi:hypothetical protein